MDVQGLVMAIMGETMVTTVAVMAMVVIRME